MLLSWKPHIREVWEEMHRRTKLTISSRTATVCVTFLENISKTFDKTPAEHLLKMMVKQAPKLKNTFRTPVKPQPNCLPLTEHL